MAEEKVELIFDGTGRMEWKFPKDKDLKRTEVYTLLGMVNYAREVLIKMLETPAGKNG